jgi:hypothetical protein
VTPFELPACNTSDYNIPGDDIPGEIKPVTNFKNSLETIESLKQSYTEAIFQTGPNDELARTKIYLAYQILGKFENHFRTTMETGQLASKQLDELRKK